MQSAVCLARLTSLFVAVKPYFTQENSCLWIVALTFCVCFAAEAWTLSLFCWVAYSPRTNMDSCDIRWKTTNSNFTSDFAILLRSSKISQKKKKKENVKTLASCSLWAAHSLVAELKWTEVKVRGYSVFFFPSLLEKKLMMNWSCRIYFHCAITLKYRTGQLGVILILPLGCVLIFSWKIPQQNAALTPELFSVGPLS